MFHLCPYGDIVAPVHVSANGHGYECAGSSGIPGGLGDRVFHTEHDAAGEDRGLAAIVRGNFLLSRIDNNAGGDFGGDLIGCSLHDQARGREEDRYILGTGRPGTSAEGRARLGGHSGLLSRAVE